MWTSIWRACCGVGVRRNERTIWPTRLCSSVNSAWPNSFVTTRMATTDSIEKMARNSLCHVKLASAPSTVSRHSTETHTRTRELE